MRSRATLTTKNTTIPQDTVVSPAAVAHRYWFSQDTSRLAAETSEFHGGIAEVALGYQGSNGMGFCSPSQ